MIKSERMIWAVFIALFVIAIYAGCENIRLDDLKTSGGGGPGSYRLYPFCLVMFMAGGIALGILHTKLVEGYPGASFTKTAVPEGMRFDTRPAKKFFALWPTGAIGIVIVFAFPYAWYGTAAAGFLCIIFSALLFLMAYWPTLWRMGAPCSFTVSPTAVQCGSRTLPVTPGGKFVQGNTLRFKPFILPEQIQGSMSSDPHRNIYYNPGANPLAAQGMAGAHDLGIGIVNATSNMLSTMYHKYYGEMRARSWQLKFESGGKTYLLANGLDGGTLQQLMDEAAAIIGIQSASPPSP